MNQWKNDNLNKTGLILSTSPILLKSVVVMVHKREGCKIDWVEEIKYLTFLFLRYGVEVKRWFAGCVQDTAWNEKKYFCKLHLNQRI